MSDHPPRETLEAFVRGTAHADASRDVILHLVAGCSACRREMEPLLDPVFHPSTLRDEPVDEETYAAPVAAALAGVRERSRALARERAEAQGKMSLLLFGGGRSKGSAPPEEPDFWTWGLCEALLAASWELRERDPAGMLQLAELAVEGCEQLDPAECGAAPLEDLRAQAWANLANACRITDRLPLAESAFSRACEARKQGTGSPLVRARLAELSASLLCDQRQFPNAFRLLDLAYHLYRRHGDPHDSGRTLIKKGLFTGYTGDPEEGIRLIARGLRRVDRSRDPHLVFQALHNILWFRVDLGELRTAQRQLWEMRPLYARHADGVAQIKVRWIEGRIFAGLGELERAEAAFRQAKQAFEDQGLSYDGALISFDLAALWLRQGKVLEVHRLASEMLEDFRARYIAREALAALLMLRDAAARNEATIELIELVAAVFEDAKDEKQRT